MKKEAHKMTKAHSLKGDFIALNLAFEVIKSGEYGTDAAEMILKGLEEHAFDGICYCFAGDVFTQPPMYLVSLALAQRDGSEHPFADFEALKGVFINKSSELTHLKAVPHFWEFSILGSVRSSLLFRGSVLFKKGAVERIVEKEESLFIMACREKLNG